MKQFNLTKGPILKNILFIAWPLILTNVINMMYNVTDMYWVSQLGSDSVAAVGSAGLYIWLGQSFIVLTKLGTEVMVGQSVGNNKKDDIKKYAITGLVVSAILIFIYALIIFIFRQPLMEVFGLKDAFVLQEAMTYLKYGALGIFFILITQVFAAIYNGLANTLIVLVFITCGLLVNMVLDPLFILSYDMGVAGAAIATTIAAAIPVILFIIYTFIKTDLFTNFKDSLSLKHLKQILKLSFIPAIQNMAFTLVMFVVTGIIAGFGAQAVAAQRIGNQIESMGWMIGLGISTATSIFVSQNFGAKEYNRIIKGYKTIVVIFLAYGILLTYIFVFQAQPIFEIFLKDDAALPIGIAYLEIIGFGQLLQLIEMITNGFFNGIGKTLIPGIISFIGNIIRIPLAIYLAKDMGINGIWYALGISMAFKGSMMVIMFIVTLIKDEHFSLKMLLNNKNGA